MLRVNNLPKILLVFIVTIALITACNDTVKESTSEKTITNNTINNDIPTRNLSQEFKKYWFSGKAEITSYQLSQLRYGELREGTAVTIFVTEDFLQKEQW